MTIKVEEVEAEIAKHNDFTRVYIGCDSQRVKRKGEWYANYIIAVIVHINGRNGCRVFGEFCSERDFDKRKEPRMRLMNEAYKVVEVYNRLREVLEKHYCEVHLDLNPDEAWASNKVIKAASGYVEGTTGIKPKVKPEAFAASYAADQLLRKGMV